MSKNSVPLAIIAGYLGAGKTTLLNHILKHSADRRVAVLVNDFGDINIDASLIKSRDAGAIHLTNGCVCCSINDNLAETLSALVESSYPPDNIVLEASGVAEPARLIPYGSGMRGLHLDGVIVLVDAETIVEKVKDKFVGSLVQRQIQAADFIALNKIDLTPPDRLEEARKLTSELSSSGCILETEQAMVPLDVCLGVKSDKGRDGISTTKPLNMNHEEAFTSWTYVGDQPLILEKLEVVLNDLPTSLVRAKGFVCLDDGENVPQLLQVVGSRWSLVPWDLGPDQAGKSEIVFIAVGRSGAQDEMNARLAKCAGRYEQSPRKTLTNH